MTYFNGEQEDKGLAICEPPVDSPSFEVERIRSLEEERLRTLKIIHDEVSPHLLTAVFRALVMKEKLEAQGNNESVMAGQIGDDLVKVIEGLSAAFNGK